MNAYDAAEEIIEAISNLSDAIHNSLDWWIERDDGTFPIDELRERIEAILKADRASIVRLLNDCSDSWGRQADQYEAVDDQQSKACAQTATVLAAAARTIEAGNE